MPADPTTDPGLRSWVPVDPASDFPIQNLPYGVFSRGRGSSQDRPRVGVAIGDRVLDLAVLAAEGLLDEATGDPAAVFRAGTIDAFLARGRATWQATRRRLSELLTHGNRELLDRPGVADRALAPLADVDLRLPFTIGDYVDFYSSVEHATNLGRMFRPDSEPLLPNWRHLPVGYHGRCSTVVVSGTPVTRPLGQRRPSGDGPPPFGPTQQLDFELEVGFVTGPGNRMGTRIPADAAAEHIFGLVLVNDWSARDIQAWEYQPLGPFLGKSFATSVSPWVVTLDALAPFRVPQPVQRPQPLPYLRTTADWGLDLNLEVALAAEGSAEPQVVSRTNFRGLYWTAPQQLAHATVNGTTVRPGDLYASGTVSGSQPGSYGSMIELTWRGQRPLELHGGGRRAFLEDGDTVVMRGWCGGDAQPRVGFGEVRGTVTPAPQGP